MKMQTPSPQETDPRLLEALASLNQISAAINQIGPSDAGNRDVSLQLIVESAIRVVPGSSAVIYTYDQDAGAFEKESRVSAEPEGRKAPLSAAHPNDAPRPNGIGIRTIQRRRRSLSYEEADFTVHPYQAALGVKAVACFPLIVAEQAVGVLYIYLHEEREFTYLEQLMLDNFVNQAAMAIYHTRRLTGIRRDLARKEEELTRLRRAGLLISSRLRLEETLESILQLALEMTNAQYGIFRLLDKSGQSLLTRAVGGNYRGRAMVEKLPLDGNSVMAYVARTREPLLISDLRAEPWSKIYYPLDAGLQMRSELAVPLINSSGRLEGVLNLESPSLRGFSEDDSHMLQSLATYAVTAIQEVRLLDALQEVAQLLLSEPSQKVLDHLCVVANDLLNASSSAIWILNDQEELMLTTSNGDFPPGKKIPLRGSMTGQAVLDKKPIAVDDIQSNPQAYQIDLTGPRNWSRALVVPLMTGDNSQALGAFSVYSTDAEAGRFTESEWDKKVLTFLANYAVLAVQNEARQQALRASQEQRWLAETFAAVGDISSNLLHNMNNKVGTIPVRVQTIQDKYRLALEADAYLANNLKEIERCAMEAMQIVQENLSHLRPIRMELVHVAPRIAEAIRNIQLPTEIHIKLEGLDDLPMVIAGGQSLIFVFKNLIENAVEAMHGKGLITVQGSSDENWVEITVADSGPGISPELHDQIFELDFSGQTGARPGKLGFGLWWVKTLMTRLGGSVAVESDGQHGTIFRLHLPRAENK
ncbi:MAG TPA: GAF domain-containing protein [Anaerolineales bacterium]|nr:GAF domain-containing protein [Anaerolineales bacterium]